MAVFLSITSLSLFLSIACPSSFCCRFNFHEDVDLFSLAEKCPSNLTGADLFALCSDAMLTALRKQIVHLESEGEGILEACVLFATMNFYV